MQVMLKLISFSILNMHELVETVFEIPRLIGLVITSNTSKIVNSGGYDPGLSDH